MLLHAENKRNVEHILPKTGYTYVHLCPPLGKASFLAVSIHTQASSRLSNLSQAWPLYPGAFLTLYHPALYKDMVRCTSVLSPSWTISKALSDPVCSRPCLWNWPPEWSLREALQRTNTCPSHSPPSSYCDPSLMVPGDCSLLGRVLPQATQHHGSGRKNGRECEKQKMAAGDVLCWESDFHQLQSNPKPSKVSLERFILCSKRQVHMHTHTRGWGFSPEALQHWEVIQSCWLCMEPRQASFQGGQEQLPRDKTTALPIAFAGGPEPSEVER